MGDYLKGVLSLIILLFLVVSVTNAAFQRQRNLPVVWPENELRAVQVFTTNPAGLSRQESFLVASDISQLFGLRDLQNIRTIGLLPVSWGTVAVGANFFGNQQYAEQLFSFAIARQVTNYGYVGFSIHGNTLSIPKYGNASTVSLDIGTIWDVSKTVQWELAYGNLTNAHIGKARDEIPQQILSGFTVMPREDVVTAGYVMHDLRHPLRYGVGVGYSIFPWLSVGSSVFTEPVRVQAGINLRWNQVNGQYILSTHPVLPATHRFGVVLSF